MNITQSQFTNAVCIVERNGVQIKYASGIEAMEDVKQLGGRLLPAHETPGKALNGYIIEPGDKVTIERHGNRGARFFVKGIARKVNAKSVAVEIVFTGKTTGTKVSEVKTISTRFIHRCEW